MTALLTALLLVAGCDDASEQSRGHLTVFAASSLTDVFGELAEQLEEDVGAEVTTSFAGSQILRLQIEQGAPADVFASADASHIRALESQGLVTDARIFARNELVVIVPTEDTEIRSFEDLERAPRVVIGDETVPVGRYTRELFANAREALGEDFVASVRAHVVSEESNVRLVRAKVELGEADAAIVYRSDAAHSPGVRAISVPDALGPTAEYYAGVVTSSSSPELARRFLDMLGGTVGRRILAAHGLSAAP